LNKWLFLPYIVLSVGWLHIFILEILEQLVINGRVVCISKLTKHWWIFAL
jgi:hypothetical protein